MRVRVAMTTFVLLVAGASAAPRALATPKDDVPDDNYTCKFSGRVTFAPPIKALPASSGGTFDFNGSVTCVHTDIDGAIGLGDNTDDTGAHNGTITASGTYNATGCALVQPSGTTTVTLDDDTESPLTADFTAKLVGGEGPLVLGNARDADGSEGEGTGWISGLADPPASCLGEVSAANINGAFTVVLK